MKELFTSFLVEILTGTPSASAAKYVKAAKSWMSDSEDITQDIREVLHALDAKIAGKGNGLMTLFGEFLKSDVTAMIDAENLAAKNPDRLGACVARWLGKRLPEKAQREVAEIVKMISGEHTVWVRSASAVATDLRQKMRKELANKYLIFNIDDDLLGGMQLIIDGQVLDSSWLGRISRWDKLAV